MSEGVNHKNMTVEDGRITIVNPLSIIQTLIAVAAYGGLLFVLVEDGFPFRRFTLPYLIAFLIFTAIFVLFLASRKTTTVFDAAERKVYRRNLLWSTAVLDFDDIAGVTAVAHSESGSSGEYYKISLKADPLGKGYRLTNLYSATDDEALYMRMAAMPALEKMFAGSAASGTEGSVEQAVGGRGDAVPELPENPVFYRKNGGKYVRLYFYRVLPFLIIGAAVVGQGVSSGKIQTVGFGLILMAVTALFPFRLILDTEDKLIRIGRVYGLWEKKVPFEQYDGIQVVRQTTNGIYTGTHLEMQFADGKGDFSVGWAYFTKKLDPLLRETEAVILGGVP